MFLDLKICVCVLGGWGGWYPNLSPGFITAVLLVRIEEAVAAFSLIGLYFSC